MNTQFKTKQNHYPECQRSEENRRDEHIDHETLLLRNKFVRCSLIEIRYKDIGAVIGKHGRTLNIVRLAADVQANIYTSVKGSGPIIELRGPTEAIKRAEDMIVQVIAAKERKTAKDEAVVLYTPFIKRNFDIQEVNSPTNLTEQNENTMVVREFIYTNGVTFRKFRKGGKRHRKSIETSTPSERKALPRRRRSKSY